MRSLVRTLFILCAVAIAVFPIFVFAQVTINYQIPGAQTVSANNPCTTVINFYWFALLISGILAFGAIVWGGIKYAVSAGNPSGQSDGKDWIKGALLGILLLAGAYLILNIVNPALVHCSIPGLSQLPSGGTGTSSANCQPPASGDCSPASLTQNGGSCFGNNMSLAAGVCNVESGNNQYAMSGTDKAADGSPVSIGLFQINISANPIGGLNCPSAFSGLFTGYGSPPSITNRALYNQCVDVAKDMKTNIAKACAMSSGGSNFGLWGAATKSACGI